MALYKNAYRESLLNDDDIKALEEKHRPQPKADAPTQEAAEAVDGELDLAKAPAPSDPEEATYRQRYADLRRHMAKKEAEWKERLEKIEGQLQAAAQQTMALPTTEDEVKKWAEAYPDVAKIVETIAIQKARQEAGVYETRLKEIEKRERLTARQAAELELKKVHPDFDQLRKDQSFHDWVAAQPRWIQASLYENETDWRAASRAIDLYKADTGAAKRGPGRPRKEEAASAVQTAARPQEPSTAPQKRVYKESEIAKMSPREFDQLEEDIMAAKREGRIVNDLRNSFHRTAAAAAV